MNVQMEYEVSVFVTVDTETGTVTEVVVDDENLRPELPERPGLCARCEYPVGEDGRVRCVDLGLPPEDEFAKALKIAERVDWPAWQFGW